MDSRRSRTAPGVVALLTVGFLAAPSWSTDAPEEAALVAGESWLKRVDAGQ
jgi:hypothetical protein